MAPSVPCPRHRQLGRARVQVDIEQVPDYLSVIAQPMDYATVKSKLAGDGYSEGPLAFAADMRRIFSNALEYNWDAEQGCHCAAKQVPHSNRTHSCPTVIKLISFVLCSP